MGQIGIAAENVGNEVTCPVWRSAAVQQSVVRQRSGKDDFRAGVVVLRVRQSQWQVVNSIQLDGRFRQHSQMEQR